VYLYIIIGAKIRINERISNVYWFFVDFNANRMIRMVICCMILKVDV